MSGIILCSIMVIRFESGYYIVMVDQITDACIFLKIRLMKSRLSENLSCKPMILNNKIGNNRGVGIC